MLAETLAALPRSCPASTSSRRSIIDDGSTDGTAEVARRAGATYLLRLPVHAGLARAFSAGLDAALKLGADVIVNTDADHQYPGARDPAPGRADPRRPRRHGDRRPRRRTTSRHFGVVKRFLQGIGSWVVRRLSGTHRARRHQRLPRLLAPRGAAAERGHEVHLHARDHHPGGQEAHPDRTLSDRDQPGARARRGCSARWRSTCGARSPRWCASTRSTSRSRVFVGLGGARGAGRCRGRRCASCSTGSSSGGAGAHPEPHPRRGAGDRRLPDDADRAGGRSDRQQPLAGRGHAAAGARARAAPRPRGRTSSGSQAGMRPPAGARRERPPAR